MWYLKTRLGTFWVAPISSADRNSKNKYYLGVDDQELGIYSDIEQAAKDVHDQSTGFYKWDSQARVRAPEHIADWTEGEPKTWYT